MCDGFNVTYFRLNPLLSETMTLDETHHVKLINAIWETTAYMYAIKNQIKLIVELLDGPYEVDGKKDSKSLKGDKKVQKDVHVSTEMSQLERVFT